MEKTIWCYLDEKKQYDVIRMALIMDMTIEEVKNSLIMIFDDKKVTFKISLQKKGGEEK